MEGYGRKKKRMEGALPGRGSLGWEGGTGGVARPRKTSRTMGAGGQVQGTRRRWRALRFCLKPFFARAGSWQEGRKNPPPHFACIPQVPSSPRGHSGWFLPLAPGAQGTFALRSAGGRDLVPHSPECAAPHSTAASLRSRVLVLSFCLRQPPPPGVLDPQLPLQRLLPANPTTPPANGTQDNQSPRHGPACSACI